MTKNLYSIILLVLFLNNGCEEIIEFPETGSCKPIPVIEAILTDYSGIQRTRVTLSTDVSDSVSSKPIDDALVRLISSIGDTMDYSYTKDGWYESGIFSATPDCSYKLEVTTDENSYQAMGEIIPMNGIDSLYSRHLNVPGSDDSAIYLYMDAGMSYPEDPRYYMINLSVNGSVVTRGAEIWIFTDLYSNSLHEVKLPRPFTVNDTVSVELFSLSKNVFDYYFKLANEVFFIDISNISYRVNLPQMFTPRALGYFQVSASDRKKIIIK